MASLIAFTSLTLDGVLQAPGRPDEDPRGGFEFGGWAIPYRDEVLGAVLASGMSGESALLLGRRTYQDFHAVWPKRKDSPFSAILDTMTKYVVSTTLRAPLPWQNSALIPGDGASLARLKRESARDLVVLGSGELLRTLMRQGLVDRYVLLVHPLVLGTGRRLFPDPGPRTVLELVDSQVTPKGVVVVTYRPVEGPSGYDAALATGASR